MSIQKIVEQALKDGFLAPTMEAEVGRICESELSEDEYKSLDRLMAALLTGEVTAMPRKKFINVMEALVLSEAIASSTEREDAIGYHVDVGDIAAYALNRLPPLYATTEEGANYQRQKAREELQGLILQRIDEGIERYLNRPESQGQLLKEPQSILQDISNLLKTSAPNYEADRPPS